MLFVYMVALVLQCLEECLRLETKKQVKYGSGNFGQSQVGSVRVVSGNANKILPNFLLPALFTVITQQAEGNGC